MNNSNTDGDTKNDEKKVEGVQQMMKDPEADPWKGAYSIIIDIIEAVVNKHLVMSENSNSKMIFPRRIKQSLHPPQHAVAMPGKKDNQEEASFPLQESV